MEKNKTCTKADTLFVSAWKGSQPFKHTQLNIPTEEIVVGCIKLRLRVPLVNLTDVNIILTLSPPRGLPLTSKII